MSNLQDWIDRETKRHQTWRQVWSFLFFATAALTVVAGAATTAVAGLLDAESAKQWTIYLAALTTVLASLEKVLRLREKWDLHRNIQTALEIIELRRGAGVIDDKQSIDMIDHLAQVYNNQLAELSGPRDTAQAGSKGNQPGP
jgi:hypothetical protein